MRKQWCEHVYFFLPLVKWNEEKTVKIYRTAENFPFQLNKRKDTEENQPNIINKIEGEK